MISVNEAADKCVPGSTNFSSCVMAQSGKMVARWSKASVHENEVIMAANAVKDWIYFVGKGYSRYLAAEYFNFIPVAILNEAVDKYKMEILMSAARYHVDLPDFIDDLIEK